MKTYLLTNAFVDRGAAGTDNTVRRRRAAAARAARPEHRTDHRRHRGPVDRAGHGEGPDRLHGRRRADGRIGRRRHGQLVEHRAGAQRRDGLRRLRHEPDGHAHAGRGPGRQHDDHRQRHRWLPDRPRHVRARRSWRPAAPTTDASPTTPSAAAPPLTSGVPVTGPACDDDYSALPSSPARRSTPRSRSPTRTAISTCASTARRARCSARRRAPPTGSTSRTARPGRHLLPAGLPVRRRREPQRLHAHGHRGGRDQADVVGPVADLGGNRRRARHAAVPHVLGGARTRRRSPAPRSACATPRPGPS